MESNGNGLLTEMNFEDLEPVEVPVTLRGKKYRLKEANTDAAVKYRNKIVSSAKLGENGKPVLLDGAAEAEPLLVSLCLFEVIQTGQHKGKLAPVSLGFVKGLPPRTTAELFQRAKKISGLDEVQEDTVEGLEKQMQDLKKRLEVLNNGKGHEDEEKNSLNGTTDSSGSPENSESTSTS